MKEKNLKMRLFSFMRRALETPALQD